MTALRAGTRIGAVFFLLILCVASPHGTGVAAAEGSDTDAASVSAPAQRPTAGDRRPSARPPTIARVHNPAAAAGVRSSVPRTAATRRTDSSSSRSRALPAAPVDLRVNLTPASPTGAVRTADAGDVMGDVMGDVVAAVSVVRPAAAAPAAIASQQTAPQQTASTPLQSVGAVANRFLTNTADWLSTLPANPISDFLSGAVYLLRRSLFPTSVGVIASPITVPLYLTDLGNGTQKLGIYATLGSGGTPVLFEVDTGSGGFFASYASQTPSASPWWGTGVNTTAVPVDVLYDSGNAYTGFAANAQVSLFAKDGTQPLLSTPRVTVGQMDSISKNATPLWTPTGLPPGVTTPPISKAFWGDFGLAPTYRTNGVTNLLSQLTYVNGVLPGYRIHIDTAAQQAWLQIGLTAADVSDSAGSYFPMIVDPNSPGYAKNPYSGLRYYGEQLFNATITITGATGTIVDTANVGMTPDTGATTGLHWTERSPQPYPAQYAQITSDGSLINGLRFVVTGTTTAGTQATVLDLRTNERLNDGNVTVQNRSTPLYYLNTGILPFLLNDAVYYLGDSEGGGTFGLIPNGA